MYTILTCMKNEGAFLVEWVAYHLSIGFDHIVVFTNDCDDQTVEICKIFEEQKFLTHVENVFTTDQNPQQNALDVGMSLEVIRSSDWVIHIDVDEFIVVDLGDGQISDLTQFASEADAIALLWKAFGGMNYARHNGGLVQERFLKCQEKVEVRSAFHKTLFRPNSFSKWTPHLPKNPVNRASVSVVNTSGKQMPKERLIEPGARWTTERRYLTWENACIHHYAIRSEDLYLLKNDRGDVGENLYSDKYFLGSKYHRRYDLNQVFCEDILRHSKRFHYTFEHLLAIDGVKEAIRRSEDWLSNRRLEFLTQGVREKLTSRRK